MSLRSVHSFSVHELHKFFWRELAFRQWQSYHLREEELSLGEGIAC